MGPHYGISSPLAHAVTSNCEGKFLRFNFFMDFVGFMDFSVVEFRGFRMFAMCWFQRLSYFAINRYHV